MANVLTDVEQHEFLTNVGDVVKTAHAHISHLQEENRRLQAENDRFLLEKKAEAIIEEAEAKGHTIVAGETLREKVANLVDSDKNLDVVQEAIKLASSNNGSTFEIGQDPGVGGEGKDSNVVAAIMGAD
jgi:hypothetical protein